MKSTALMTTDESDVSGSVRSRVRRECRQRRRARYRTGAAGHARTARHGRAAIAHRLRQRGRALAGALRGARAGNGDPDRAGRESWSAGQPASDRECRPRRWRWWTRSAPRRVGRSWAGARRPAKRTSPRRRLDRHEGPRLYPHGFAADRSAVRRRAGAAFTEGQCDRGAGRWRPLRHGRASASSLPAQCW